MEETEDQLRNRIDNLRRQLAIVRAELASRGGSKSRRDETRSQIDRLLRAKPMRAVEIAEEVGTSQQNVRYLLKKYFVKAGNCRWAVKS